jgi:hypothetical protein
MASVDLDGDGDPDLAVSHGGVSYFTVLENAGEGHFLPPLFFETLGDDARSLAVDDFDGDGRPDVAVGNSTSSTIAVFLNGHGRAPRLRAITLEPGTVVGGGSVTGQVTLDLPAGPEGMVVTLGSSAPAAAQLPATVTVAAGETAATFSVATTAVPAEMPITVTADAGSGSQTATLTVRPMPRGVLIVAADEWATTPDDNAQYSQFIHNVASYFTGGALGSFLVYSSHWTFGPEFQAVLTSAGHDVTVTLSPASLDSYDAVFVGGNDNVDRQALAEYIGRGGKVYLAGGTAMPAEETFWNVLLQPFGVSISGHVYTNFLHVTAFGDTPIFAGISSLRGSGPTPISLLPGSWPNTHVVSSEFGFNWWAIYDGRDVEPEVPFTLQLLPQTVLGGGPAQGVVTLPAPAPETGTRITLSSDYPAAASVPESVTVAPGAIVARFSITTRELTTSAPVTLTGLAGTRTRRTTTLLVAAEIPGAPQNLVASATSQSQLALKWSDVSEVETGFEIERRTAQTPYQRIATVDANITGYTDTGLFGGTLYTYRVRATNASGVSRYSNEASTSTLPVTVLSLELMPGTVTGGGSATGTVTLDGPAPEGGAVVSLGNDHPEVAEAPQYVTVPEGATTTTFDVTTPAVTGVRSAHLLARYGIRYGTDGKAATLTVVPGVVVASLTLSPATLEGGGTATATVTLSGAAPAGGAAVTVASEDSTTVSVPATVTVAAGESSATFQVATGAVAEARTVVLTASDANGKAQARLTLQPGTLVATEPPAETEPSAGSGEAVPPAGGGTTAPPLPPTTGGTGSSPPGDAPTVPAGGEPTAPPTAPEAGGGGETAMPAAEPDNGGAPEAPARVVAAHGIAVLRPSTHEWFFRHPDGTGEALQFGGPEDLPVPADYLGLGQPQVAVFRPSTREWFIRTPEGGSITVTFGGPDDMPVPGDYLGLGRASLAVYRMTTGQWYVRKDDGLALPIAFGVPGDVPVPGDYLGLGHRQLAVYRPGTAEWVIRADDGALLRYQWGTVGDVPVWGDYLGLGRAQIAVYRPGTGEWFIRNDAGQPVLVQFGGPGDMPAPGDYFGVGRQQMGVYRPSEGTWYLRTDLGETVAVAWGGPGDWPLPALTPRYGVLTAGEAR